jgi:hypothetical protein
MATVRNDQDQDENLFQNQDEQKQDNAILTSTTGDIGAEPVQASASGSSERPRDAARAANVGRSQVLERNLGKSGNPFQFQQTRQALQASKGQVQSEYNTYMQNAVTPYQYGTQQQEQVRDYARGKAPSGQPDWLSRFQQGTPTAPGAFTSTAQTSFAPVNALKTNAGVRNFLRDSNDPEARSGEAAIDFSMLNADPQFNINREQTLKDYEDLIKTKGDIEANAQAEARKAQLDAASKYRQGIISTLEEETAAIEKAAQEEETKYDVGFGNLDAMRGQVLADEMRDLAANSPENLRSYFFNPMGRESEFSKYFKPATAESTKAEDFISGEQAANFNRIMAALGKDKIATAGRLAGKKGPEKDALGFDRQAFRDAMTNRAIAEDERARNSPFANTGAYDAGGAAPPGFFNAPAPAAPAPAPSGGESVGFGEDALMKNWEKVGDFFSNMGAYNPEVKLPTFTGPTGYRFSDGGRVPGMALTDGDSPANDVVSAKLSPGEIVIPRSSAGDKESAKDFIDNMPFSKTRELLKNKYACGGKVQDQYNCGGTVKRGYADGGRVGEEIERQYDAQYNAPIPEAQEFKKGVDDVLTKYIVDPLAERGYENLGAGLATIPSTLMEAAIPSTAGDVLMSATPFPKIRGALKRGTSEALSKAEPPKMPEFKAIKKPYDEKMLDPAEQTVKKVLAALENEGLSAEQKQALADFVRSQYILTDYMTTRRNITHQFLNDYDANLMKKIHPQPESLNQKSYDDLEKAFNKNQIYIRGRDPRVRKMMEILNEDRPFEARDTTRDRAKDLQYQMYKKGGR